MSSKNKNLSSVTTFPCKAAANAKVGVVVSEWNPEITDALKEGAVSSLLESGVSKENILVYYVPGTFELPMKCKQLLENNRLDGVIALGCVIQGETPHFGFICNATANGLMQVGLEYLKPCIFGVITTLNMEQALARSGGKHGNKGVEAAVTLLKLL